MPKGVYKHKPLSEEAKRHLSEIHKGGNVPWWKGDKVGYRGLHMWIRRERGNPTFCTHCPSIKNLEWANISGEYKHDIADWLELCRKCHRKYDKERLSNAPSIFVKIPNGNGYQFGRRLSI